MGMSTRMLIWTTVEISDKLKIPWISWKKVILEWKESAHNRIKMLHVLGFWTLKWANGTQNCHCSPFEQSNQFAQVTLSFKKPHHSKKLYIDMTLFQAHHVRTITRKILAV